MFFTFMNEGKLDPKTRMVLPEPGMPGQPMFFVVFKKAAHAKEAKRFVEFVTSPETQAKEIVTRFNWYPGIDAQYVQAHLDQQVWNKLFKDVTPQDLSAKGKPLPMAQYFKEILEAYEREGNPYFATARLWDDGVIDPLDTRRVLSMGIEAAVHAPIAETRFGVFRM